MNYYEILYESETTPISVRIDADDPYSACMILGRKSQTKKTRILKITEIHSPTVIWNGVTNGS